MDAFTVFAIQNLFSFVVCALVLVWFVLPALRRRHIDDALTPLLFVHSLRYVGLTYIVPVVTDPDIPPLFSRTTGCGDLLSATLALISILALRLLPRRSSIDVSLASAWLWPCSGCCGSIGGAIGREFPAR